MKKMELNKEPVRVLQCTSQLSAGGVQSFLLNYSAHMDKTKIVFDYIVQTDEKCEYDDIVEKDGSIIHHVTSMNISIKSYMNDLYKILKEHPEYQIVHANLNFRNIFSLLAAKKARVKVRISHSHSNYAAESILKKIRRWVFRILLPLAATDYWACSELAGTCLYGKSKNVKVIHNAIETEKFLYSEIIREEIRKKMDIESKEVWLHVGMFGKVKNHDFLIDLFAVYLKKNPETVLILCGDGEEKVNIENKVKNYNIADKVYFMGKINNVCDFYNVADVMLCTSLYEGLPLVCIEAQASGCAIVASNAVPKEALWNENTIQCEDWNFDKWEIAIKTLLKCQIDRKQININCKHAGYDINTEAQKLEKKYLELYEGR